MHSGRILVVEPDDDLRRSLTFVLAAYGYTVVADQGWPADAISGAFDCIVLDEQVMSKSSALPRVLLSGWPPVLLLAYSEGALANEAVTGVIAMPLKGEAVPQAVEAAIGRNGDRLHSR